MRALMTTGTPAVIAASRAARIFSTWSETSTRGLWGSPVPSSRLRPTAPAAMTPRTVSAASSGLGPKPATMSAVTGTETRGDPSHGLQHRLPADLLAVGIAQCPGDPGARGGDGGETGRLIEPWRWRRPRRSAGRGASSRRAAYGKSRPLRSELADSFWSLVIGHLEIVNIGGVSRAFSGQACHEAFQLAGDERSRLHILTAARYAECTCQPERHFARGTKWHKVAHHRGVRAFVHSCTWPRRVGGPGPERREKCRQRLAGRQRGSASWIIWLVDGWCCSAMG